MKRIKQKHSHYVLKRFGDDSSHHAKTTAKIAFFAEVKKFSSMKIWRLERFLKLLSEFK